MNRLCPQWGGIVMPPTENPGPLNPQPKLQTPLDRCTPPGVGRPHSPGKKITTSLAVGVWGVALTARTFQGPRVYAHAVSHISRADALWWWHFTAVVQFPRGMHDVNPPHVHH